MNLSFKMILIKKLNGHIAIVQTYELQCDNLTHACNVQLSDQGKLGSASL
jgi:hypothetical protein